MYNSNMIFPACTPPTADSTIHALVYQYLFGCNRNFGLLTVKELMNWYGDELLLPGSSCYYCLQ